MSTQARPLEGAGVLITRPRGRGGQLALAIGAAGGRPYDFPVIAIQPNPSAELLSPGGIALEDCALAIFVSVPAVEAMARELTSGKPFPAAVPVAAIGPATCRALEGIGVGVRYQSGNSSDSEGLLGLLGELSLTGCDVVIYRGQQGRSLLEDTLATRGARVHPVECYRRVCEPDPPMERLDSWLASETGILTLSSVGILDALLDLVPPAQRTAVLRRPTAVLSGRIADSCRMRGFSGSLEVAADTGVPAMIDALVRLYTKIPNTGHDR